MSDIVPLPPPQPPTVTAGWYPDNTGHLRWWDGYHWGAYAPPSAPQPPYSYPGQLAPVVFTTVPVKTVATGYLFLLLLGGFAAHHFYLRNYSSAVIFLCFWWIGWITTPIFIGFFFILVAIIWWIIDLFTMTTQVNEANRKIYGITQESHR